MDELFLLATVAGQAVAIRSDQVESVVDIGEVIPVPRASAHVRGLAALRSRVVTVIDTGAVLDHPASDARHRRAVVTLVDGHHYALLVEALDDVTEFRSVPFAPGLVLAGTWSSVVPGMIERDGHPVLIVDLPAIVARIGSDVRHIV